MNRCFNQVAQRQGAVTAVQRQPGGQDAAAKKQKSARSRRMAEGQ
jgi:hypothetical protein